MKGRSLGGEGEGGSLTGDAGGAPWGLYEDCERDRARGDAGAEPASGRSVLILREGWWCCMGGNTERVQRLSEDRMRGRHGDTHRDIRW